MPTYTVHEPPPKPGEAASDPERFLFVRDGFHFWAFVLAPFWLLVHRLWLALAIYAAVNAIIGGALYAIGAPSLAKTLVELPIVLLVGIEAAAIWRWTLTRRGWKMLGFVVGDDAEAAEQRFFSEWTRLASGTPQPAKPEPHFAAPVRRGPPSLTDVIGLFPEPGGSR
jgi:Protein of unknown function (DUF2628)